KNVIDGEAELLEQLASRRRLTKGGHADNPAVQANVLVPVIGDAGFDGDTVGDFQRQHLLLVLGALGVEYIGRRHRHNANTVALLTQLGSNILREAYFRAGSDQDQIRSAFAV